MNGPSSTARLTLLGLALLVLSAPGIASRLPRGENLITPFVPDASEWNLYRDPSDASTMLWKRKANDLDQYAVSIYRKAKIEVDEFRQIQDEAGGETCAAFQSTLVEQGPVNGYPRLVWTSTCKRKDDGTSVIVHMAIKGRDSFYHVLKMWRSDVPSSEVTLWEQRLKEVLVCDTRKKDHPCPEGYSRVE